MTALSVALAWSRQYRGELGREIQAARTSAGVSQRVAAARVGMSHAQLGRIERGELEDLSVDQLCRACAAVGIKPLIRAIADGGPALDSGQLALLGRLRAVLPQFVRVRTEVPLPIPGDRRAWDAVLQLVPDELPTEAEARLRDIQAVERRCGLKLRDSPYDRMLLLVADTANNRQMLAAHRDALRELLPLDSRTILRSIRVGRTPEASGIAIL
jgi:transcriptional regulator with XRE-family HTH domain